MLDRAHDLAGHARPGAAAADWWRDAVVYQVYPRSFADGNGDGLGDLVGLRSRLPYLEDLGLDALWLSPFYPSPLADGGYDIADHRAVDPRLGTLDDFADLTEDAHARGLKILIDVVPNHTSADHPWFDAALASPPGSAERERYIFRDGTGPDGSQPPSDWRSHFGGSAWTRVGDEQWYCHLFAAEQPDLNWDNPEVRTYFLDTLRFWADLGVDGFRIDVAHSLAKDLSHPLRSQPYLDQRLPLDGTDPLYDRDEVHEIYRTWRAVFEEYDPPKMAVAETWTPTSSRTYLYGRSSELGQVFDFSLLKASWDPAQFRSVISRSIEEHRAVSGGMTWVLSNHDVPRHATRYALPGDVSLDAWLISDGTEPAADDALGRRRARAATLLMLALPGSAYLYQGEELGLTEVADLGPDEIRDPVWERSGHTIKGRDGCRVPLPWTSSGTSLGFGTDGSWLPQPSWFGKLSAESQADDPTSSLAMYRAALDLRREWHPADAELTWLDAPDGVLHVARSNGWQCVVNFTGAPYAVPAGTPLLCSTSLTDPTTLPPDTAVWLAPAPTT